MAPDSTTSPRACKFAVDNSVDFWENARRFPHHAPPDRRRTPDANVNDTTSPSEFLSQTFFVPSLSATDKQGVLAELADVVVARGIVPAADRDAILAALVEREEKMSTGMQYGIAIPHAKTEFVDRLVTMIAVSKAGGPFETLDGEPAFTHVPDWYAWERAEVRRELEEGTYLLDTPVEIGMLVDFKAIYMVGEGRLRHDSGGFTLDGCDGKLHFERPAAQCYSLYADYYWYELGDIICIGDRETQYYCFPKGKVPVAKARLATEEQFKRLRAQKKRPNLKNP